MSEAICKKCRKEGEKLFLKGEKCESQRCPITLRTYTQRGGRPRRISEYGEQLKEKQKVKKTYGIREQQFSNYFKKASKAAGVTGEALLNLLEQRIDNVIFRMGFADSRSQARQMVSHAHFMLNKKKVDIPSIQTKAGDEISVSVKFEKTPAFSKIKERLSSFKPVSWLELNKEKNGGKIVREARREDIDAQINESLIVEFYSR